jgi:hypothetical protein
VTLRAGLLEKIFIVGLGGKAAQNNNKNPFPLLTLLILSVPQERKWFYE